MINFNRHTLVHHFLEESARIYPDKTALVHGRERVDYSRINFQANQLANWLLESGLKRGDRVAIMLDNSLEYIVSYYGTMKAGAVAVPLSPDSRIENVSPILSDLEAFAVIAGQKFVKNLKATSSNSLHVARLILSAAKLKQQDLPIQAKAWDDILSPSSPADPDLKKDPAELCSIIYTSGSTGKPKGVMLSHGNIVTNVRAICSYLELTSEDIQMVVLPFFYVMGQSLLNTHFAVGGKVVVNNQFAYPATVVNQLVDEKITGFSGVPSTFAYLLHRSPLEKFRDRLHHLRYCSQAGGHMPHQLKKDLRRALPDHTRIFLMYGATEASARLTYLDPADFERKMDSIGKPIDGVTLKVLNSRGEEVAPGEKGELVASGPNIMQGYWKDPQATAHALDSHGYHTGDVGCRDDEGFFYVFGRKDGVLKVSGHRINPQEIEDILMESGELVEVAVIGIPDKLMGAKLCTLAVAREKDCSENQLMSFAAQHLPRHKLPGHLKLIAKLPKGYNGKIDRGECERMAVEFFGDKDA